MQFNPHGYDVTYRLLRNLWQNSVLYQSTHVLNRALVTTVNFRVMCLLGCFNNMHLSRYTCNCHTSYIQHCDSLSCMRHMCTRSCRIAMSMKAFTARERRTCRVGFVAELPHPRGATATLRKDTAVIALKKATAATVLTLTAATQR